MNVDFPDHSFKINDKWGERIVYLSELELITTIKWKNDPIIIGVAF